MKIFWRSPFQHVIPTEPRALPRGDEESPHPLSFAMGFLTLAFGSVRNDEKRDCTITTNYAASKTTLFRRMVDFDNPPASLRSAPSLTQGGQDKRAINIRASKIAFCASAPHLRIPARVAARRVLRAFGTAERRAFYACRSSFAKIFSNENILAMSYNDVAKGFTCYAFCAPICCSRSFCGKRSRWEL